MTLLAPTLASVLHRSADHPARRQPAHDRRLPRHAPAAARASPTQQTGKQPCRAGLRRPRRAADRRVPRPPRARARQQPPDPQRAARGDPLALPLRRAAPPRARRDDRARDRDPDQTPRPRPIISYLTDHEINALLAAPDRTTWLGRRDHALLLTSDPDRRCASPNSSASASATSASAPARTSASRARAARNAARRSPAETVAVLRDWLHERQGRPDDPLFPTRHGRPLTPEASRCCSTNTPPPPPQTCPSLTTKRVTPHVLRHTNAMLLRAENVDIATIALWLGHESTNSTEIYLHADNKLKQQAIDRTAPPGTPPGRYQPPTRSSRSSKHCDYAEAANPINPPLCRENDRHRAPSRHNRGNSRNNCGSWSRPRGTRR